MQNTGKSRKPLIIGIVAAVVILAAVLVLLLTQCTGGTGGATTVPSTTETSEGVPTYQLYWNIDRAEYDGKSEAGMSSRMPDSDGYFHVRFMLDGEEITVKVADRKVINAIDIQSLMGLEFDENGIVIGVIGIEDLPLEKVAWQFYVQSAGGKTIKANSSSSMNGMEVLLEGDENTGIYNMSGLGGEMGSRVTPITQDRIYAIQNLAGELTHVFIYERPNYMATHEAECPHCKKVVTWYEYTKTDRVPFESGHYQLQNDIVSTVGQTSLAEDVKICLDLNGKRVDGKSNSRVYSMHNPGVELAIMDTSAEQNGTIAAHGKADAGMCVWVRYGAFYFYGGILDGSDATTGKNGPTVTLQANTYMYMYGGEIIGGTSTYTYNESTKKYGNGLGGTMMLNGKSKFVMYDGVIRDGFAECKITEWNKDGTPKTYQRGLGGNIFMSGGAVMELNGGVIKNGKAGTTAGNIYMDGASELTINGGSIQGGRGMGKGKNGGSLFISTKATVYLKSGRITGGGTYNCGGNVYLNGTMIMSGGYIGGGAVRNFTTGKVTKDAAHRNIFIVNGTFRMYGGSIDGGVQATDSSATDNRKAFIGLTTYATIDGGEESNNNLTLSWGAGGPVQVNVGELRDSAKIRVKAYTGIFTTPTDEKNLDNFSSDIESAQIHYYNGCLALGRMNCVCGSNEHFGACDGTEQLWAPHVSTTALPNKDGYFYLDDDVKMSTTTYLRNEEQSIHTRVDLNGKSVTSPGGKGGRVYSLFEVLNTYDEEGNVVPNVEGVSMEVTVTDSAGGGKITLQPHDDYDQGIMFWGRFNDSVLNFYGGTFDGSAATSVRHSGVVISSAGDVNIYGGSFVGGNSVNGGIITMNTSGKALTMTGGSISGGKASNGGGNVYLATGAVFDMSGGTVSGGKAMNGGNIYMSGKTVMNLSGGTITGGVVDNSAIEMDGGLGGNIYQNGTFTMTGGTISDGYVRGGTKGGGHGGNIGVYGTAYLLGGTITGGEARVAGGNIGTIATGAVIVLDGVRVENGKAGNNGGNIASYVRTCKTLEIKGDTVITGGSAPSGGNISARHGSANGQNLTVAITGGTIENGTATSYGGNIFVYNNTSGDKAGEVILQVENVTITGGTAGVQGGNIFFEQNGGVRLKNAVIEGGVARQGGNIFLLEGKHTFTDSVIRNGHAMKAGDNANGGNLYLTTNAKLDLVGTTVENGQVTADTEKKYPTGGNIYFAGNAKITMDENSVISGGKAVSSAGAWSAGGNIYAAKGTFDIYGGTVTGGEAYTQGNNIHIIKNATVTLHSGKLENTYSKNQSVYMEGGIMNIAGGEVINTADNSRNFSGKADQGSVINMSGGTVSGGKYADGGNFYIPSGETLNISGGIVTGGTATTSGGNIFLTTNGILNMTGGTVEGGTGNKNAGNIYVSGSAKVNMSGGTVEGGQNLQSGQNGGSIFVASNAVFTLSGGTVKNGSTANGGGNFYVNGTLNIAGDAHITGGTKNGSGINSGNIACVNGTLNISGGVIDGDVSLTNSTRAGAFMNLSGKVVINRGKAGGVLLSKYEYDYPATITIDGTLAEGSHVVVRSVDQTVITTNATVEENLKFFESADPEVEIIWLQMDRDMNGDGSNDLHKLFYGLTYCICGVDSDDPADHLGDCGGELLVWQPWTKGDSLPTTTGNWYLTKKVVLNSEKTISTSENINIDLNGFSVSTAKNMRVFRLRNPDAATTVNIGVTDTSAAKTGVIDHNCTACTLDGGIVWLTQAGHTFSLYGGVLDASDMVSNTNGTAIKANNGVVNIHGGTVKGGHVSVDTQNGAGMRISAGATLNMTGGTLEGGSGTNWGGVMVLYGTANITGGTIKNGNAKSGSCIGVIKSAETEPATLNISNATIYGGIRLNNHAGACTVKLSGKVIIDKTLGDTPYGIDFGSKHSAMDVSGLTEGSRISVTATDVFATGANETIKGYFTADNTEEQVILDGDKLILGRERCLCGNVGGKCISAVCDGTKLLWTAWGSTTTLPTKSGNYYLTVNVTPASIVSLTSDATINLDLNGKTISRGGRVITGLNRSNSVLTITDTSAAQTGTIKVTGKSADQGGIWVCGTNNRVNLIRGTIDGSGRTLIRNSGLTVCVTSGNTFNMYGGTVIGGTYAYEATATSLPYGGAAMRSAGTTNIYGGTIQCGTSDHLAGGICIDGGVFTLAGGTIQGGNAANGGAVAIQKGEFRLQSGTISGGVATETGGNIYIDGGKFIMTGGTITGGKAAAHGGNIHQAGGTVELLGGTVEKGSVTSSASESGGGNLAANAEGGVLTLNGVTVKDGTASQRGGNIYLYNKGIDMTIAGKTVISGGTANYGANICLNAWTRAANDHAVVTMQGGTISGGYGRANAGGVYLYEAYDFILNDGTITGGEAKGTSGNIHLYSSTKLPSKFVMNGGTIEGGKSGVDNTAGRNGGNIYISAGATFELNGGTVSGGTSTDSAGNIYVAGNLLMTGGTVTGGTSKNAASANVAVVSGTFEMRGGKVDGNVAVVNASATADSRLILSGEPVISGGTLGVKLARSNSDYKLPVISVKGTLGAKASIVISREVGDCVISDTTGGASQKAFSAQDTTKDIAVMDDGCLYLGKYGCVCGGVAGTECAKAGHPKVTWTAWTSTTTTPGAGTSGKAGNYYLTGDISVSGEQHYPQAIEVNIDLNGYNITGNGDRVFRMRNDADNSVDYALTIGIKNSRPGEGKGVIISTKQGAPEGFLVFMTKASHTFNLYSGVMDGAKATTDKSGCFSMYNGTFNMYGGELKNGKGSTGGNLAVKGATAVFNLYGGTISGGEGTNGGNIYVSTGTVNLNGGSVTGGKATNGGNIYANANVNLKGTDVTNGAASSVGGNIYVASAGKLVMTKGSVTGGNSAGSAVKDHENIYCKFGTVDLRGGLIDGFVMIHNYNTSESTIKVSGDIKLTGGTRNLVLAWGKDSGTDHPANYPVISLGKLTEGAKIGITTDAELFAKTSDNALAVEAKGFFTADSGNKQVVVTAQGLAFADSAKIMGCICGGKAVGVGDHECVDVEWTETDAVPTTTGNYILTDNVEAAKQRDIYGQNINIDLNGHEITVKSGVSSGRVYRLVDGTVMNITDSSEAGTGKIIGHGGNDSNPQGGVFVMSAQSKLNLYAGTITSTATNNSKSGGGVVYTTQTGTTFTMYGGRVTGGKTTAAGGNLWINSDSTFVMYGGKIDGGSSSNGKHSNIHVKFAHAELYGGEITGGVFIQNYNTSTSTVKIAGNPVIYGEGAAYNLVLGWSKAADSTAAANYPAIELGKLTEGANIHVSDVAVGRVIAKPAGSYVITAADVSYLTSDKADTQVVLKDGNLEIAAK